MSIEAAGAILVGAAVMWSVWAARWAAADLGHELRALRAALDHHPTTAR